MVFLVLVKFRQHAGRAETLWRLDPPAQHTAATSGMLAAGPYFL
jgi:hypothetical protein